MATANLKYILSIINMKCANNYAQKEKTNEIKMDNCNQSSMHRVLTTQAKQMLETLTDKKIAILSLEQKKSNTVTL